MSMVIVLKKFKDIKKMNNKIEKRDKNLKEYNNMIALTCKAKMYNI